MNAKNIMLIILIVIGAAGLIFLYARWFERSSIFFPMRQIETTPESIGLNYEDVYFNADDGVKLNGWLIPAVNPRGTILVFHGNAGNISHRLDIIKILNELSLNVFIIDYRGYGRSRGIPSEKGMYSDAKGAYNYLTSRSDIDKENIIIFGKSIGAAVAVDLAQSVEYRGLISDSAFTSTIDMGREIYPFLPVEKIITMKFDTVSKIKNIKKPKLIIHSTEDEIVPFSHGKRLFDEAAEPKEFYNMRGGHNDSIFLYREEYKNAINNFISDFLEGE